MWKKILLFVILAAPAAVLGDDSIIDQQTFLNQVLAFVNGFGGLSMLMKISGVITLLVGTAKITALNKFIWKPLGRAQAWVAPVLGLIAGILGVVNGEHAVTFASIMAYVGAGAGAVFLHEILDTIKAIPGLGEIYVNIINLIEKNLGGPASKTDTSDQQPEQKV